MSINSKTLSEKADAIKQIFSKLDSWEDKYEALIRLGKEWPGMSESERIEDLKVKGCQSQVWIKADLKDGRIVFKGDSDAIIVKGLVALVLQVYSNETPNDILTFEPQFIKDIGLDSGLSPSRTNGLFSMIRQIKYYATAYQFMLSQQKK